MVSRPKKLLDQVREAIQLKHYSSRTGEQLAKCFKHSWIFRSRPLVPMHVVHLAA